MYWSFSFNISPSNGLPGLIFTMDWLELLAVQGTLKSLLQHQGNSKFNIHLHYHLHIFFLHFPFLQSKNLIATIWSKKTVTERSVFSCIQTNTQTFGHFMDASILKVTQFCITSVGHVYIFLSWDYFRCPKEGVCRTKTILMTG